MTGEVNWTIIAVVHPGKDEALHDLAHRAAAFTKGNEPGVVEYLWNHSAESGACSIHVKTGTREAAVAFLNNFERRFLDHLLDCVAIQHTLVFGNPHDNVRKKLANLEPVYMAQAAGFERAASGGPSLMM